MTFPVDIELKIQEDFENPEESELVRECLSDLRVNEKIRIIRNILFVSNGNLETFSKMETLAKTDYRDVILIGEYEYKTDNRLRDFNQPFKHATNHIDSDK